MKNVGIILSVLLFSGCAVPLTQEAQQVRTATAADKERCKFLKLVTFNQRLGPDKPGNAMKSALNETAAAGGNAFYVVSTSTDWAEGASIVGEALLCPRGN
jgi:hypothetical protein